MTRIRWEPDEEGHLEGTIVNVSDASQTKIVDTDWDYPSVASTFGWDIKSVQLRDGDCEHRYTDGTIDCPDCHIKAGTFIEAAGEWLRDNDGAETDDPGYFS